MKIKKQPKITIVTLIVNRPARDIKKYLDSVSRMDYKNFKVILLINSENYVYANKIINLTKAYKNLEVINNKANLGFCAGTNIGIVKSLGNKSGFTLLLNDDVLIKRNLLKELVAPFLKNKKIGLVSPIIMQYPKTNKIWYGGGYMSRLFAFSKTKNINKIYKKNIQSGPTDTICGCCVLVKNKLWQKIGLLDENLFMYFDDTEISLRAQQNGYRCYLVGEPLVVHLKKSKSLGSLESYFYARNPFFLIRKYYRGYNKITAYFGQFLIRLPRNFIRLKNKNSFYSYLKGIRDGLGGV